jgi:hypothetical protein
MFELGAKITALGLVLAVNVVLLLDLGMAIRVRRYPGMSNNSSLIQFFPRARLADDS